MIKDILVQVDDNPADEERLKLAEALAGAFGAYLTGVHFHVLPGADLISPGDAGLFGDLLAQAQLSGRLVQERLALSLKGHHPNMGFHALELFPEDVSAVVGSVARTADLFVMTRPYGASIADGRLAEAALFGGGRACLFVPRGLPSTDLDRVMIAWKDTREAARAIAEALPFLKPAAQVLLVHVEEDGRAEDGAADLAGIALHLSRHGIAATTRELPNHPNATDALIHEIDRTGTNLLVMGGYGHSKFREWLLGGMTRSMLGKTRIATLVAH